MSRRYIKAFIEKNYKKEKENENNILQERFNP